MTIRAQITGYPRQHFSRDGKHSYVTVFNNQARRARSRETGDWEQRGDDIPVEAILWNEAADKLIDQMPGDDWLVTVEGALRAQNYETKDGEAKWKLVMDFPKIVGFVPPRETTTNTVKTEHSALTGVDRETVFDSEDSEEFEIFYTHQVSDADTDAQTLKAF